MFAAFYIPLNPASKGELATTQVKSPSLQREGFFGLYLGWMKESFEYIPFKKRILKMLLVVVIFYGIFLSVCIWTEEIGYIIYMTLVFFLFFLMVSYREKYFLTSLSSDKSGIKIEYYQFATPKSVYVDWHSFNCEICYPLKSSFGYLKFKNQEKLIGNFYLKEYKQVFEISYLLTKAKHDANL